MSIEPIFTHESTTSFNTLANQVNYLDHLVNVSKESVYQALVNAINDEYHEWGDSIAQDTGAMELEMRLAVGSQLNGQRGNTILKFNLGEAVKVVSKIYAKYHYRQSPDFNPAFSNGYKNPSKTGTVPMDARDFIPAVKIRFKQYLVDQMKKGLLDA